MNVKCFSERINRELQSAGFPSNERDKAKAFAKVFKVSPHMADSLLHGQMMPSKELLEEIAKEFEVSRDWLVGKD
jgi:transcriptional regulator with XRE-family HTH domain